MEVPSEVPAYVSIHHVHPIHESLAADVFAISYYCDLQDESGPYRWMDEYGGWVGCWVGRSVGRSLDNR